MDNPSSYKAFLPYSLIAVLTSAHVLAYNSSILAGWILPSLINVSRVSLAISLLNGSKLEITIASGVSSIIKSTPVTDSIVLIFLPSLPINLPFISSLGNAITDTVCSLVISAEYFCIVPTSNSLLFSSTSNLASASFSLIYAVISFDIFSSTIFIISVFACSLLYLLIFSNSSSSCFLIFSISSFASWIFCCFSNKLFSLSSKEFSLFCIAKSRRSILFSLWRSLSSCSFISPFFSFISLSASIFNLCISSLVSNKESLLILSASFFAFSIIESASFSWFFFFKAFMIIMLTNPTINPRTNSKMEKTVSFIWTPPFFNYIL